MNYQFGAFELDLAKVELRESDKTRAIEPQVFALLALLVENRERLVSKDEIIEKVWDGRIVSDAAVSSRIKSARHALGDDGKSQRFIRTIRGQGYRFVASAKALRGTASFDMSAPGSGRPFEIAASGTTDAAQHSQVSSKPSLSVLPFRLIGKLDKYAALAVALPDELITELSRLRWLLIIARGSSFRLAAGTDIREIGTLLQVRYCLSGTIEILNRNIVVAVELADTKDGGIIWADRFSGRIDDVHVMREDIRSRVLVALEIQIPVHEANLARHRATENLDAWSAYHLGLQQLYRFNRIDNVAATGLFQRAVTLDPGFARAYAGLSFMHFQSAFMRYSDNISAEIGHARRFAERGVELDPLDPFVNFTMGRTYWLEGDLETSLSWLERSTTISPHYAQGIYARAWTEALANRAQDGRTNADLAMRLSPLDPLHYAMRATRAFTHMALGEDIEAAHWADRAASSPGAHVLIAMIAAAAHALALDAARAAHWASNVRERNSSLTRADFSRSFPMQSEAMRVRVLQALAQLGF
jgi:DNA-binding winged helix-turn-helix (wHTH) protein/tetratricopeptide (TPR) repeat protein